MIFTLFILILKFMIIVILQKTKVNEPDEDNNVNRYRVYRIIPYEAIKAIKFYDDLIKKAIIKLKFDVDSQIIKLVNESSNSKYERIIDEGGCLLI